MSRFKVDLVLADWLMRPMDGLNFAQALRRNGGKNARAAIVMVSAHSESSRVKAARDAGVNSFLVKPISARSLFHHVSSALHDQRPFVDSANYAGPDRRRGTPPSYEGPFRRAEETDEFIIDVA